MKKTKQAVLDGSYFEWQCPGCGQRFFANTPFLYNDDENGLHGISSALGIRGSAYKVPTVIKTDKNYDTHSSVLRLVSGFSEFVEKIRIFEAGLDDRIVEAIKLLYINMHTKDGGGQVYDMIFENTGEDGSLYFGVFLEDDDFEQAIPAGVYENAEEEFTPLLPDETHEEFIRC